MRVQREREERDVRMCATRERVRCVGERLDVFVCV